MTPGQEALREAARLEAARVYGRTIPETPRVRSRAKRERVQQTVEIVALHEAGQSLAAIALRVGCSKSHVHDVIRRAS